jgi:L-alanine-DL-glutamate epimerase-like enolase superfamily enzyme
MSTALEAYPVRLHMGQPFVHAGKSRRLTASVLLRVDSGGVTGWGEAAPRPYVTGETVNGVLDALAAVRPYELDPLLADAGFEQSVRRLAGCDWAALCGPAHPSAAAAMELAVLDLVCRRHGRGAADALRVLDWPAGLLRRRPAAAAASYVIDLAREPREAVARLHPDSVTRIRHVKLKATTDVAACVRRTAEVRDLFGPGTGLSVDVNGAWAADAAVDAAGRLRELGVAWLEEPVAARDWIGMRRIRQEAGMAVMLDESCSGVADLRAAADHQAADHVNARISKCGGVLATLRLIAAARELGLGAQLGVHVGEVGPLWAAGRLLACNVDGLLTSEAGKQDEWFPQQPLTEPPYAVDRRAYLAPPLDGPGLGVVPAAALLDQCIPLPRKAETV